MGGYGRTPTSDWRSDVAGLVIALLFAAGVIMLAGCYETASTYDPQQGRYRSTQDMKQEQRDHERDQDRRIDRLEQGQR